MNLKTAKEIAVKAAALGIFGKKYTALNKRHATLATQAWESAYGDYREAINSIPQELLGISNYFRFQSGETRPEVCFDGSFASLYGVPLEFRMEFERLWERNYPPLPSSARYEKVPALNKKLGATYETLHSDHQALVSEIGKFLSSLRDSLRACKNSRQLIAAWPEVGKHLPAGWDTSVPVRLEEGQIGKFIAKSAKN